MERPNILFLFADDMRYDTISALGNPEIKTSNLDKLASNGTSFMNAHIPGGTVAAVCMPSRAMLNTGRNLFHLENAGEGIPCEHTLLGEALQKSGYNTFGTGKWHNGYQSFARSFNAGAEIYFGGMYDHWKVPVYHYDPAGEYPNVVNDVMNPGYDNWIMKRRTDHVTMGKHSSDLFSDAACNYLKSYSDDKPFYMYVAYMAPHDPRTMPKKYLDMYDINEISLPPNFYKQHPFDFGVSQIRDEVLTSMPRDEMEVKKQIMEYYAMISHLDDTVGKVIESLKKSGKYDNTIIIFSADNGLAVGQHGLLGKQNAYDHSIKVPLIISGPGIPKNELRSGYVYLYDIFPTLCDYTGTLRPESVDGISFKKMVTDPEAFIRERLFAIYGDKVRTIKDGKYKLIEYKYKDLRRTQLFDLENDPYETNDLRYLPEMQQTIERLRDGLWKCAVESDDVKSEEGKRFWTDYLRVDADAWGF